jgi:hypothetical protein
MKGSRIGILAAGAVAGLLGSSALAESHLSKEAGDKACYRTHCGKSVKGHEGKCGGTKVEGITQEKACQEAGGAWTTAADAKKFEGKEG